jgi:glucose/arabinose dehydrogenase
MRKVRTFAVTTLVLLASGSIAAPTPDSNNAPLLVGQAAMGGWQQDNPGVRRLLTPQDLPPISKASYSEAEVVPMPAGAKPRVPSGFIVEMVASGLNGPRVIREAPNGDLFVAEGTANDVRVLRMAPGNTKPSKNEIFATDLYQPYGIAFYPAANPQWV